MEVNEQIRKIYYQFDEFITSIEKSSSGIPCGLKVEIPLDKERQFPALLNLCS